jgi:hypothetical protein
MRTTIKLRFFMKYVFIIFLFAFLPVRGNNFIGDNISDDNISFYYSSIDRALVLDCTDNADHRVLIDVYNLTGNSIFKMEAELFAEKSNLIQLDLKPGLYIICITENNKTVSKKVMIK